ncbi:hypothetical protein FBD94_09710 [Pedobacter hiemivivus]|uniref:Tox-HNH-HHH domain-containing protein n=1 Tax=Pedobacter hiemivivus TaxID=2530454 RepID=A0A4U1GEG5_9SPHI|nr:hypothetical protein [Pedobacter hiemivivus]TKC62481.1 hypothetical protein FBD94_09710 [Pedobacter hiemivivus]
MDGVEYEGESIVIYDSDNNVVAYYFTPNTTSTIFPLGYYYSIGNGRPSLNLSSYSFDFGPPAIIPGGIRSYTGGKVDDVVIPNMIYPAEWHEIEDNFGILIAELANQGIDNGDPIPDMYYRNDGTPIDMLSAPAKGRTVLGVPRNSGYFWRELYKKRPEMFSPENKDKIFRKPNGISPEVDEQWIRYNPSHKPYDKTPLIHHHDRQGRYAYALPAKVHQKWSKIFHEIRSKGGISKIGGKLNSVAGALQIFSILTDLRTGNPDGWINWFGPQNIIGRIYKDNEKDVYFQITSKEETRNSSGTVISAVVTYHVFADYVWDDDENMYMGVQKLGTYTETIDVINAKTIRRSFGII